MRYLHIRRVSIENRTEVESSPYKSQEAKSRAFISTKEKITLDKIRYKWYIHIQSKPLNSVQRGREGRKVKKKKPIRKVSKTDRIFFAQGRTE